MTRLVLALIALMSASMHARANDAVGRVDVFAGASIEMCSGTLIRPDLVLTAAHCVANPEDGYAKPLDGMVFLAGWSGAGHAGAALVASVDVHPGAFSGGSLDITHDVALIALMRPVDIPGLPLGVATPKGPFTLLGYGGDAPDDLASQTGCTAVADGALWRLGCPIRKGQSGGPVLLGEGSQRRVVAVIVATTEDESYAVPVDDWLRRAVVQNR